MHNSELGLDLGCAFDSPCLFTHAVQFCNDIFYALIYIYIYIHICIFYLFIPIYIDIILYYFFICIWTAVPRVKINPKQIRRSSARISVMLNLLNKSGVGRLIFQKYLRKHFVEITNSHPINSQNIVLRTRTRVLRTQRPQFLESRRQSSQNLTVFS